MKLILQVDETDLAMIFAGFTRIEHGPDTYEQIVDAWEHGCAPEVRDGYVEEARKFIECFRQDHDRRRAAPGKDGG